MYLKKTKWYCLLWKINKKSHIEKCFKNGICKTQIILPIFYVFICRKMMFFDVRKLAKTIENT